MYEFGCTKVPDGFFFGGGTPLLFKLTADSLRLQQKHRKQRRGAGRGELRVRCLSGSPRRRRRYRRCRRRRHAAIAAVPSPAPHSDTAVRVASVTTCVALSKSSQQSSHSGCTGVFLTVHISRNLSSSKTRFHILNGNLRGFTGALPERPIIGTSLWRRQSGVRIKVPTVFDSKSF